MLHPPEGSRVQRGPWSHHRSTRRAERGQRRCGPKVLAAADVLERLVGALNGVRCGSGFWDGMTPNAPVDVSMVVW